MRGDLFGGFQDKLFHFLCYHLVRAGQLSCTSGGLADKLLADGGEVRGEGEVKRDGGER